ncbi:putative bifunctional diguanylate cyclase/phosphodiesterase [Sulfurovum riftiae]|uniref:Diguanylate cyclase n=1 Tax=Sulfurovum riftiae TaxID=1630136 RepID=A0A151CGE1_9BACT|nr:EAL domain-containing protein [Sulfurovum riftiae]KYJ86610.1 diguanylate cyclase [Sulfurovum riftiae]
MNRQNFYTFLQKHILLMIGLSLLPGLAYIGLAWLNGIAMPALVWYGLMLLVSWWGWSLYKEYRPEQMSSGDLKNWYLKLMVFFYIIFALWSLIFVLYANEVESRLHYIAIFTQLGAAVVASTLLISDKRLFFPVLVILMLPLVIYFSLIGEWYGYVLSIFSLILWGVLLYASDKSYQMLQKNYYQAQHDALTGLFNRRYFVDYMDHLIKRVQYSQKFAYILLIDLDHFKTINDTLGHEIGDKVLIEVARRIKDFCGKDHLISRLGGDEFTIISEEFEYMEHCREISHTFAKKLLQRLKEPYLIERHHLYLSASIGVNGIGHKSSEARHFIKEADIAMYEAKAQGRDGIIVFNEALAKRVEYHLELERRLYFALEHNEIDLRYQPQMNSSKELVGCEVLVRWRNDKFGFVPPAEFIGIAEKTGLIIELGHYIMEESFKTLQTWDAQGIELEQFSINLSVRQFFNSDFLNQVEALAEKYLSDRTRKKVVFEVTETILIEDMYKIIAIMNKLRRIGISFSLDDFGTGYSSLSSLRQMPIDELKVDRTFVSHINKYESDKLMITTILAMAKIFNLKTVAEGVENEEQFEFLKSNGCNLFQGFYFSKALEHRAFETFYLNNREQRQIEMNEEE